jgi:hypothetical protein
MKELVLVTRVVGRHKVFPELGRLMCRRTKRRLRQIAGEVAGTEPVATVAVKAREAGRPRTRATRRKGTCHFAAETSNGW